MEYSSFRRCLIAVKLQEMFKKKYKFCQICQLEFITVVCMAQGWVDLITQNSSKTFLHRVHVIFVQYHF